MALTREQIEIRRRGIFGSDAGAVLGLSPWKSPYAVWWSKVCPLAEAIREGLASPGMHAEIGNAVEPVILERLARERRYRFERGTTLVHPSIPCIGATPDGLAIGDDVGLEAKWSSRPEGWTDDEIPDHFFVQVVMCLAVTGRAAWDVGAFVAGKWRTYRFYRDEVVEREVVEACRYFWHEHVLRNDPPPPGPLDDVRALLLKRYPKGDGNLRAPTLETRILAEDYARALAAEKRAKAEKRAAQHALIASIGEADGIEEIATYKTSRGKVAWAEAAKEIALDGKIPAARVAEIVERHRGDDSRRWRWLQESEDDE